MKIQMVYFIMPQTLCGDGDANVTRDGYLYNTHGSSLTQLHVHIRTIKPIILPKHALPINSNKVSIAVIQGSLSKTNTSITCFIPDNMHETELNISQHISGHPIGYCFCLLHSNKAHALTGKASARWKGSSLFGMLKLNCCSLGFWSVEAHETVWLQQQMHRAVS